MARRSLETICLIIHVDAIVSIASMHIDEMPGDDATSKSPSPEPDKGAHATSSPPVAEATRGERKKSWFKRLFPGKSQKQKEREAMRRSRSEPTAVKLVTSDNSSTDREMSPTPALGTLPETDDSPVDDRNVPILALLFFIASTFFPL